MPCKKESLWPSAREMNWTEAQVWLFEKYQTLFDRLNQGFLF